MCGNTYRVLIADDDFRIGQLINTLIQWDELGLTCVNIVSNGRDALQCISEGDIDIAITDIQMPLLSGLDLIASVKEKGIKTRFIVISGYKDFEYAHRALQYEVSSYLLKPIDADELNDTLRKMIGELAAGNQLACQKEKMQQYVMASKQIIKRDLLQSIIDQTAALSPPEVEALQQAYQLNLTATAYLGLDIKLDYLDWQNISEERNKITVEKVMGIINDGFKAHVLESLVCERPHMHVLCLLIFAREDSKEIRNSINGVLIEVQHYLLGFERYRATIGIGEEVAHLSKAAQSLQEAQKAIYDRVQVGTERLIYFRARQQASMSAADISERFKERFQAALVSCSAEEFESSLHAFFDAVEAIHDIDSMELFWTLKTLIKWFFMREEARGEASLKEEQQLLDLMEHCNTLSLLRDIVTQKLTQQVSLQIKQIQERPIKPIRQAKEYMAEHSGEKIVLEEIAELVGLNPVYFSNLFKKETGMNFSAYLINVRMDSAKKLLTSTNETIAAIADRIGYKDVRYFSKLFTKTVGVKPAVYRRLYS